MPGQIIDLADKRAARRTRCRPGGRFRHRCDDSHIKSTRARMRLPPATRPQRCCRMTEYALDHVPDSVLLDDLRRYYFQERGTRAIVLAHIAEVDERKLYAPAGYSSMFVYCVEALGMSKNRALKRIQAARTARRFPAIFPMLCDGVLCLGGVCLLAPHLTPENDQELLDAARGKTSLEIEAYLHRRFPPPESLPLAPVPVSPRPADLDSEAVENASEPIEYSSRNTMTSLSPQTLDGHLTPSRCVPGGREFVGSAARGAATPSVLPPASPPAQPNLAPVRVLMDDAMQKDLHYLQILVGDRAGSGATKVVRRALRLMIHVMEKRLFARSRQRSASVNPRSISTDVKSVVWQRDGGRCTFLAESGNRCTATHLLEFDHVQPVARGGRSTVENLRLRCPTHNQLEAERVFGAEFMKAKRAAARADALRGRVGHDSNDRLRTPA